ncbi:MAG: peptide/nickel transport system substrate-binding protein [Solirubrobacteraceae bacterium]
MSAGEGIVVKLDDQTGLSRREALRLGGMSVAALMTPALLSACGSSDGGQAAPAITGRINSGQSLAPTTLDPHVASQIGGITIVLYAYEGLYGKSPTAPYGVRPELAAGNLEELSPTSQRVALRSGATFHDGSPVTAKDVVESWRRIMDPKTASFIAGFLTMIKSVKADGDDAVIVTLNHPTTLLKDRLALVKIMPASLAARKPGSKVFNTKPVGSGPYQVVSVTSDLRTVELDRFAAYKGPTKVSLPKIGLTVVPDDQARIAGLQTKRLAAMVDPPFSAIDQLGKQSGIDTGGKLSFQQSLLIFNNGKKPFTDNRIRRAILSAIDRDTITKSVFFGHAEAATSYLPSNNPDYKKPATSVAYDPDRARALLAEAGVSNLSFRLNVSNLGWLSPQAPLIQSQLKDVGINIAIHQGETESLVKEVADKSFDAWLTVTDPSVFGNADGEFLIRWAYGTLAGFMYWTDASSKQMAGLLQKATESTSADEVHALVGEMQDLIAEQVPSFPLHHRDATAAWSTGLDLALNPVYGVDLRGAKLAA